MEMGKLTAKLRDAVPVCLLVEGKEIKRYKNIEIPDELKRLEYQDFKFDVPLNGAEALSPRSYAGDHGSHGGSRGAARGHRTGQEARAQGKRQEGRGSHRARRQVSETRKIRHYAGFFALEGCAKREMGANLMGYAIKKPPYSGGFWWSVLDSNQ